MLRPLITLIKESKKQQVLFKKYYKVSEITRKVLEEKNPQKISEYQNLMNLKYVKQLDDFFLPYNKRLSMLFLESLG